MVSQGRVGALVAARPEERRAVLEEAANIFAGTIRGARYAKFAQATVDTELLPDEELA